MFISYARDDAELARELAQGIRNRGDRVFFDADSMLPASDFNAQIEKSIRKADRFVFLASSASLSDGRYTLTELNAAKAQWPSPVGKVVTVLANDEVGPEDLDAYLRSVQVFRPSGNLVAEVLQFLNRLRPVGLFCRLVSLLMLLVLAAGLAYGATWYVQNQIGRTAEMRVDEAISIGHWTGAPTVLTRLTFTNSTNEIRYISIGNAELVGPYGQSIAIASQTLIFNGMDQLPPPSILIEPDRPQVLDYEFRGLIGETLEIHQELSTYMMSGRAMVSMQPTPDFIPADLTSRMLDAAELDWVWTPGTWRLRIPYRPGIQNTFGEIDYETIEFDLDEAEIDVMRSWMEGYHTGAGVAPNWRRMTRFGTAALINKVADRIDTTDGESAAE
ncbi:MAG: toll/interleukin-1 receptor domain-containing protein [Pseudomonadota bacterium]